jgi:predicted regulator of Ras-like GTPase activity (Roadblock/LC7/MglB family)
MVELELSKTEKAKRLTQIITQIKKNGNLLGILFAYRDGGLIAKDFNDEFNFDNFTSMCASVLESAIGLGRAMGDRKAVKIITELGNQTIIITECDEKTFLVFDLSYESDFNAILEKLEEYIRKIIFLY